MTLLCRVIAGSLLALLAACDRDLYVGRDMPLALRDAAGTGAAAPVAEPPVVVDAGASEQAPPPPPPITTMQPPAMSAPANCDARHADCDGDVSNGCESDLTNDRNHCGACAARCETPDCSCDNGKLTLHCDNGRADCDAMLSNGCETDITTSMQHCGACNSACHTNGHDVTSAMCTAGRCQVTCAPRLSPEADCDGNPDNGCESYLMFDAQNCGQCGKVCRSCEAGTCMN